MFKDRFDNADIVNAPWREGDVMHTLAQTSAAEFVLGFKAKTSLHEGLRQTWHWWNFNVSVGDENNGS